MSEVLLGHPVLTGVLAAAVSAAVIALRLRFVAHGLDRPGHRSLHARPTPHGGGVGIVAAALACGLALGVGTPWLVTILVLAAVSWADDWLDIAFWIRLLVHVGCAAYLAFTPGVPPWSVALLQIMLLVWATNAYNFMDGADGLAGSMAVTGFAAYAIAFAWAGHAVEAGFSAAVVGGALGFLYFNWHPARIFMGDVGSIVLGFLAGGLGWHGSRIGAWPEWFAPLVFSPFLLDASATLVRRILRGEAIWRAHRDHYYQRMVRAGLTHAAMCRRWLVLMILGGGLALSLLRFAESESAAWAATALWSLCLALLGWRVDVHWARHCRMEYRG